MCVSLGKEPLLNLHSQIKESKTNVNTEKQARKIQTRNQIQAEEDSFIHL